MKFEFPLLLDGLPLSDCLTQIDEDATGIYVTHYSGVALYVGMTMNFRSRLSCAAKFHHQLARIFKNYPAAKVVLIEYPWWKLPESDLNKAKIKSALAEFEQQAIQHYRPRYNREQNGQLCFPK